VSQQWKLLPHKEEQLRNEERMKQTNKNERNKSEEASEDLNVRYTFPSQM
jgi:hypothetical protein